MTSPSPSKKSKTQPSASTGASKASPSSETGLHLLLADLYIHLEKKRYTEHAETNQLIANLISKDRTSPGMTAEKARLLAEVSDNLRFRNEASSVQSLLPLIFPLAEYERGKPGLDRTNQACFRPGCVPMPKGSSKEPQLQALLESNKIPSTPRPDVAFGIEKSSWSTMDASTNNRINELYGNLAYPFGPYATSYPFLIAEWKSEATGGRHFQAAAQAARGSAALISNMHKLLAATSDTSSLTEDNLTHLNTVFSATVDSERINIYVHWSEPVPGTSDRSYQMSRVKQIPLSDPDILPVMQRTVNNIIDWGLLERRAAITKLIALQRAQIAPFS